MFFQSETPFKFWLNYFFLVSYVFYCSIWKLKDSAFHLSWFIPCINKQDSFDDQRAKLMWLANGERLKQISPARGEKSSKMPQATLWLEKSWRYQCHAFQNCPYTIGQFSPVISGRTTTKASNLDTLQHSIDWADYSNVMILVSSKGTPVTLPMFLPSFHTLVSSMSGSAVSLRLIYLLRFFFWFILGNAFFSIGSVCMVKLVLNE